MTSKLYNGDCLEEMNKIEDSSIDLILCDLPYGMLKCKWDIVIPFELLWTQYNRILKKNGAVLLFGTEPFSTLLRSSNLKMYKYDLIWEKSKPTGFLQAKIKPMPIHENISVFYKKPPTYNPQMWEISEKFMDKRKTHTSQLDKSDGQYTGLHRGTRRVDKGIRYPQSILCFNSVWKKDMHPTQKPVPLLEYLVKTYTNEGDTVLDSCFGSGSCGVASVRNNRNFIGIELEENYFNKGKIWIEEEQKKWNQPI